MIIRVGKPKYRIELLQAQQKGEWFHRVVSERNGQTIYTSETYSSEQKAEQTVYAIAKDTGWKVFVLE